MNDRINALLNQIVSAANSVYIRGCDGIAQNNMAQLVGICQTVEKLRTLLEKGDKTNA